MKKRSRALGMLALLIFTTGCWDQDSLRDARLANATAYDFTPEGMLKQTLEIVDDSQGNQGKSTNEIHSGTGNSLRQSTDKIRAKVTGDIRYFKYGVILYSESVARKDLYPYLDVMYREPDHPTSHVKIAIVDGLAGEIIEQKSIGSLLIGEFIAKKIRSLEEMCVFPEMTLETLLPPMLDPGQDFALPYLSKEGEDVIARGIALFHGQRFTGNLDTEQGALYVLMTGKWKKTARFVKRIHSGPASDVQNFITYQTNNQNVKRHLAVKVQRDGQIDVNLSLKLPVTIVEYARDHLQDKANVHRLNDQLSEIMTKDAEEIIRTLQKSGCDAFGIGRQLIAHHPAVWKSVDWNKEYPNVRFHTQVTVDIVGNGILN
ncbi:Ger(x)C family spore germination protein [Paenibacillus sp. Aloe-11]|uniref:Ger(x)C family spore germination protein n=1 Tax=Paenibacillus sp. Aloe-11 TaxID=1050222 RepID=UPI00024F0035|nr:Ger(x)C family spore germination protein [Paenibacillus sp. Aloe-11]EHS56720.1 spore germination protein kc [Paenibacillus sp. Aloe-11]